MALLLSSKYFLLFCLALNTAWTVLMAARERRNSLLARRPRMKAWMATADWRVTRYRLLACLHLHQDWTVTALDLNTLNLSLPLYILSISN